MKGFHCVFVRVRGDGPSLQEGHFAGQAPLLESSPVENIRKRTDTRLSLLPASCVAVKSWKQTPCAAQRLLS